MPRTLPIAIIGAGPAGLAAAIRLKQINPDISCCILEKGSEIGAHIIMIGTLPTLAPEHLTGEAMLEYLLQPATDAVARAMIEQ